MTPGNLQHFISQSFLLKWQMSQTDDRCGRHVDLTLCRKAKKYISPNVTAIQLIHHILVYSQHSVFVHHSNLCHHKDVNNAWKRQNEFE